MNIWILDDLHWKEIYKVLKVMLPSYTYPIKKDVKNPLPYLKKINDWDLILLDNYFDWWNGPIWDKFLKEYLNTWMNCQIIAISDFWEKLTEMFNNREKANIKWDVIWWVKTKKWEDIAEFIKNYFSEN